MSFKIVLYILFRNSFGLSPENKMTTFNLMENEMSYEIMSVRGTTAVTFFQGELMSGAATIRNRFVEVAKKNPWAVGSLDRAGVRLNIQPFHVRLTCPSSSNFDVECSKAFKVGEEGVYCEADMSYDDIVSAINEVGALVDNGNKLLGDSTKVASKLTFIPGRDGSSFAFVFSLSHVVADGYTFYKLLNMLSERTEIESLTAQRNNDAMATSTAVLGEKETAFMASLPQVINWVGRIGCRPREKLFAFKVDKLKVHQAKAAAAEETSHDASFVSTNDIITSSYGRAVKARTLYMASNLRGRLLTSFEGNEHAGNYEGAIFFGPQGFKSPIEIRKKIQRGAPFSRQEDLIEIPGPCESLTCISSQITSWAFPCFSGALEISGCTCILHLPIPMFDRTPFELAIVFKPTVGNLAVLFSSLLDREDFERSEMPLSHPLLPE